MDKSEYITSREAALLLGVSLRTVQLWVESGALRAWKTEGGHRRIDKFSVEEIISSRQQALDGEGDTSALKVLVVEDSIEMLKLYERYFEHWQFPVDLLLASNGFEGLIQIGQYKPALVISDLVMPGMDGFEMIKALKNDEELKEMGLIVVTGLSTDDIAHYGGLPDGVEVLRKPVDTGTLKTIIQNKLNLQVVEAS